ncbi:diguanylate cyclase [Glaciecola sp. MH2013]|uniref:sensor domain-containing diguanylate cyclase n=1 Tax=Glaciecola sp. MH2013 TaxID=2785524 RepID=UPI00189E70B7|nr:diguanylate cyclase [Glaciecola sp. MH2013]MBF7074373.1 diguanylate cyclase [Glaciecola sp. MH2013]
MNNDMDDATSDQSSLPTIAGGLLVGLLTLVTFVVILLLAEAQIDENAPAPQKGRLDLSKTNLAQSYPIALGGEWVIYWKALLSYNEITQSSTPPNFVNVPHTWVDDDSINPRFTTHGFATYRLSVTLNKANTGLPLGILMPSIGTAYQLYIDDVLLAEGGVVAKTKASSIPHFHPGVFIFTAPSDRFDIIIQVSNQEFYWGGMWHQLKIGSAEMLHAEQNKKNLKSTIIISIFFTITVFNLIQFSLHSKNTQPLLIAVICVLLGFREMESSHLLQFIEIAQLSFATSVRINFLTFYVSVLTVILYLYSTFTRDYKPKLIYCIAAIPIVFSLGVIVTSVEYFSPYMRVFQVYMLVVSPYLLWGILRAVYYKRKNARLLLTGTLFLFFLMVNDILDSMGVIDSVLLVSFGLVAFMICLNYITYSRFIQDGAQNIRLNLALDARNKALENLSKSLENKVTARTQELADANTLLSELAFKDPLTGALNRRGVVAKIDDAKKSYLAYNTSFCVALVDFDNFKKLNDLLGHETGDKALKEGTKIIQECIRKSDVLARWGGEEFLILLQNTDVSDAELVVQNIREMIEEVLSNEIERHVSVTIGLAQYRDNETIEQCISRADEALYVGKNSGRNCVKVAQ